MIKEFKLSFLEKIFALIGFAVISALAGMGYYEIIRVRFFSYMFSSLVGILLIMLLLTIMILSKLKGGKKKNGA